MGTKNVIDVSKHNGVVTWSKVKGKCDGVIVRCGYRGYGSAGTLTTDPQFKANITGAIENGIKVGVYWLSQAITTAEAVEEANYITSLLKPYKSHIELPVYIDSEWSNNDHNGRADSLSKADRTSISVAFLEAVKKAGYIAGIYASTSWFSDKLDDSKLKGYTHWVADYRKSCGYSSADAWQYTDKGKIDGISGYVDKSYFYKEFAKASASTTTAVKKKSNEEIAKEVVNGKWGNGTERKTKLTAAGYDYSAIQKIVNSMTSSKVTQSNYFVYTVKKNDTLWKIAQCYLHNGTRYKEIKKLNGLVSDTIHEGQPLKIPKK